jgi:hypothetical protein
MNGHDRLPDYSGHLSRNSEGQFTGLIADGKGVPIYISATVVETTHGRHFELSGTKGKAEKTDVVPWDDGKPVVPMPAVKEFNRFARKPARRKQQGR